jgi:prepilin-type N-terminal cleavage/methylation domain-containing protein
MRAFRFNDRAAGFTLIEATVSLAILALTLSVVYQSFGWALRRGAEQRQREWAWLTAQSFLSQMRADRSLAAGRQSGRTPQGLAWESTVEPYTPGLGVGNAFTPLEVTIRVSWGEWQGRSVELHSVELRAAR